MPVGVAICSTAMGDCAGVGEALAEEAAAMAADDTRSAATRPAWGRRDMRFSNRRGKGILP
jgi:hypothetical protein